MARREIRLLAYHPLNIFMEKAELMIRITNDIMMQIESEQNLDWKE